jgi:hypothetical protein
LLEKKEWLPTTSKICAKKMCGYQSVRPEHHEQMLREKKKNITETCTTITPTTVTTSKQRTSLPLTI